MKVSLVQARLSPRMIISLHVKEMIAHGESLVRG